MNLDKLRSEIDTIDRQVIELLNARIKLASEIGHEKAKHGSPFYVPSREEEVFSKLDAVNTGPLDSGAIRRIYREVISAAIALEKDLHIAYLGPEATYTHQAAIKSFGSSLTYIPYGTIPDVFAAVEKGEADYGVIPIENSTEGAVFHSLDMLAETDLKIVAQQYLEISHCLISHSSLDQIKRIYSKDNALGQCRSWLSRLLPHADRIECSSTAKAVQIAKEEEGAAAIASALAADLYNVPIQAERIEDATDNVTRFLVVGEYAGCRLGDGRDKSSFMFTIRDEAGALISALRPFGARGISLSKIESRPSRKKAWDYYFFIDIIGHFEDLAVKQAVAELERTCPSVRWLGSYPNT